MKNNKASFKSFRKKVVSKEGVDAISPGIRHGETLIPKGSSIATIELPETKETFTYEIINSDSMTGDIKIAATEGSLKGLILNSNGGNLSVSPVPTNCKQVLFETTLKTDLILRPYQMDLIGFCGLLVSEMVLDVPLIHTSEET